MVDLTPNSQSQIYMKCVKNCAENWYLHLGSKGANVINGSLSHICNILCNHRLLFCFQTWKLNNLRRLLCTSMQGNVIFGWNHIYIAFSKRSVRKAEQNSESKARYWRRSDKAREVWVGLGRFGYRILRDLTQTPLVFSHFLPYRASFYSVNAWDGLVFYNECITCVNLVNMTHWTLRL